MEPNFLGQILIRNTLIVINLVFQLINIVAFEVVDNRDVQDHMVTKVEPEGGFSPIQVEPKILDYEIENPIPGHLSYDQIRDKFDFWEQTAPEIVEVFEYGKSSWGVPLTSIRLTNEQKVGRKPTVLVTACIHGNEPLSAGVVMGYIGTLIDRYNNDEQITSLIDSRNIYFVPVVSPDSYPHSRKVDGVDPNRNFPRDRRWASLAVPPVQAIMELYSIIQADAVISGHTWGRVYLTPWGDKMQNCKHHSEYKRIVGRMADLSQYRYMRLCDMYQPGGGLNNPPIRTINGIPIYGTEADWYYYYGRYRNEDRDGRLKGAFSIVMELGTHQRVPTLREVKEEHARTFEAVLFFMEEAPLVNVEWDQ